MTDQTPAATVGIDAIYAEQLAQKTILVKLEAAVNQGNTLQETRLKALEDRAERHGGRLLDHDKQLSAHALDIQLAHSEIQTLKTTEDRKNSKRAPWWSIVGAIVGIIGGSSTLIAIFIALSKFTEVVGRLN